MVLSWTRVSTYRVVPFHSSGGAPIAAITPVGEREAIELDAPHVFREFAALAGQGGPAYCAFATRYGLLGLPSLARDALESLDEWALESSQLDLALVAWDLQRGSTEVDEEFELRLLGVNAKGTPAERRKRLASFVASTINGAISRQLHRHSLTHSVQVLVPSVQVLPHTLEFAVSATPTTLIDLIWAQAVNAMKGWQSDYRMCRCGKNWIAQPPWKKGPKKRACSDACRASFDQKDEALARRLARQRLARSKIVEATGLREDRVKKIVREERERRKRGAR